jgi:NTP pyrophosphatase (non-canonical NTP hydrolase)
MDNLNHLTIRALQVRAGDNARKHGFGFPTNNAEINEKLLLIVSEITEAMDELRAGIQPTQVYTEFPDKPCGFGIELADAVIRILDLASCLGIDLEGLILQKMTYNEGRPFKHGKEF